MAKKTDDFVSKDFNLLVPFTVKAMTGAGMGDSTDPEGESLIIEGFANWFGEDVDESGEGVACDLANEAVVPTGIDLSVYKGNPQILWQHDREYSIGKANKTTRKAQGLFVNATIYQGAMEEEDWFRVKNGLITRFSIGFRTMAGEYKEVAGKEIFFITKSLLMEISLVTIPCSSESAFSIIKSLDGGAFISTHKQTPPTPTEDVNDDEVISRKKDDTTMRLTLKELLTEKEVAHLVSLGLEAELDTEKEVSTKAYIDQAVKTAVEAATAELRAEIDTLKAAVPVIPEVEEATETVKSAEEIAAEEAVAAEEALALKEAEDLEAETIANVEFKSIQDELDKLKALLSEEK